MRKNTFLSLLFVALFSIPAQANINGTDLQNFNPNYNGLDFITVFSSDTLPSGVFNFGAFLTYQINTMPYFERTGVTPNSDPESFEDWGLSGDLHAGFGIIKGWDIGVGANYILDQSYENVDNSYGFFSVNGLTDVRIATKIRLMNKRDSGLAVILGMNIDRVQNNPFSGDDPDASYAADIAYDMMATNTLRFGLNVGYRLRGTGEALTQEFVLTPISDQIAYSLGFNYLYSKKHNFLLDIYGSTPVGNDPLGNEWVFNSERARSNLEAALGWRYRIHRRFDIHAGVGREIYHGLTTPDFRAWVGFNWRLGPIWGGSSSDSDRDGVKDSKDKCPNTPREDRANVDDNGCADHDGDGLSNWTEKNETNTLWDNPDTDGDGLLDGEEIKKYSTDPTDPDTDDGGVNDGDEVQAGTNPVAGNGDDDGGSERDSDGDGVLDGLDKCPNTAVGVQVDDLGCDRRRVKKIRLDKLNFVTNTATMVRSSRPKFDEIVSNLQQIRGNIERVIVEGHTDSRGKAAMNKSLSQRRADRVAELLSENLGMDREKFEAFGYGEERPIAGNQTRSGRLKNRRVELRLIQKRN